MNKGVILAGGIGTRLSPLTKVTNKHLLPVYNLPMIYYPLNTLVQSGIDEIMIITGKEHCGSFIELLGSEFNGVSLTYRVQERAGGIAEGVGLCKNFIGDDDFAVLLSDNIFEDKFDFSDFRKKGEGARVYFKQVDNPQQFGVARIDNGRLVELIEKPKEYISDLAQTGLYLYDNTVFDVINKLKPSGRGELEITDVNNAYLRKEKLNYRVVKGEWIDAGSSFEDLYRASEFIRNREKGNNKLKRE